jgi:hypothetical protein
MPVSKRADPTALARGHAVSAGTRRAHSTPRPPMLRIASSLGNRALGVLLQRKEAVSVRSPSLEVSALVGQQAFATARPSPLTSAEVQLGRSVFGSSIDFTRVRIAPSPVIAAPTTLGDTIRVPPSYVMPAHVLIHELTHIWQYQTKGTAYVSDSAFHQSAAWITSAIKSGISQASRGGAYNPTIVSGKSIHAYTAEEQATIVEQFFLFPQLASNADYQRMIGEVRASRPRPASLAFDVEQAAGLPPRQLALPPRPGNEGGLGETRGVPLIEFRF